MSNTLLPVTLLSFLAATGILTASSIVTHSSDIQQGGCIWNPIKNICECSAGSYKSSDRSACQVGLPSVCGVGTYLNAQRNCQLCHRMCLTCHGPLANNCSTCPLPSFHLDGTCILSCPQGYVGVYERDRDGSLVGVCKTCSSPNCQKCSRIWPYVCQACTAPALLTASGRCVFFLPKDQQNQTLHFAPTMSVAGQPQDTQTTGNYNLTFDVKKGGKVFLNEPILAQVATYGPHVKLLLSKSPFYGFLSLEHGNATKTISNGNVISVSDFTESTAAHLAYVHDGTSDLADLFQWEAYTASPSSRNPFAVIKMTARISPGPSYSPALLPAFKPTIKLQILEGQAIRLPSTGFNLGDVDVKNAKYMVDSQLKYGELTVSVNANQSTDTVLSVGDRFTHKDLSEGMVWYKSTQEIGSEPVQEELQVTVAIPIVRTKNKGANGRHSRVSSENDEEDSGKRPTQTETRYIVIAIGPVDNQAPTISVNSHLTVEEGGREIISPDTFTITDLDSGIHQLILIVDSPPQFGYLVQRLPSEEDSEFPMDDARGGQQFPLQALLDEQLSYEQNVHRLVEPDHDIIGFRVTDGMQISEVFNLTIIIENVNDEAPTVHTSVLRLKRGESVPVDSNAFEINDLDTDQDELILKLTKVPTQGHLVKLTATNSEVTDSKLVRQGAKLELHDQLTWADILDGLVAYVHSAAEGSSNARDEILNDSVEFQLIDGDFNQTIRIPIEIEDSGPAPTSPLPTLTSSASLTTQKPSLSMQFGLQTFLAQENTNKLRLPVIRTGDLSIMGSVICATTPDTAESDKDFVARPLEEQSRIFFLKGVVTVYCDIELIDDSLHEGTEHFSVHLSHPQIETSPQALPPELGPTSVVQVTLDDSEDIPTLSFEKSHYQIQRNTETDTVLRVNILRHGDDSRIARVAVTSRDGSARQGVDFLGPAQEVAFGAGEKASRFQVTILRPRESNKPWPIQWRLYLKSQDNFTQIVFPFVTTVTILPPVLPKELLFPAEPVVVSLLYYDSVDHGILAGAPSGYPLVCLHSCDNRHPRYNETLPLCRKSNLLEANIKYSWEVAAHHENTEKLPFRTLSTSTLFGSVHHKVLDAAFFTSKMAIRCSVQANLGSAFSLPSRSAGILIKEDGFCPPSFKHPSDTEVIGQQPFLATLSYSDSDDEKHADKFHIAIEIPHTDGMVPLVSTRPLYTPNHILTESWHRSEHRCSNLLPGYGFLTNHGSNIPFNFSEPWPYFMAANLRQEATVRLYQNLDLATCTWNFDAWYSMGELVDLCGGHIDSNSKTIGKTRTAVTVRVPLHIALITANTFSLWTSIEHRTEMDFSFYYTPSLWRRGLETHPLPLFQSQVTRVNTDSDGKLQIEFKTLAQFQGQFVLRDPADASKRSFVQSPRTSFSSFHLELVSTRENEQFWRAASNYSLQDYSGLYRVQLVPCVFAPITPRLLAISVPNIVPHTSDPRTGSDSLKAGEVADKPCRALDPVNFSLPIVYQQPFRPVPVAYSLNTIFYLTKDPGTFKSDQPQPVEEVFSPGDHVYGFVAWTQSQTLNTHYRLVIEQLYLCAGNEGYVPAFNPTGENSTHGPQYGCLENNPKLKHRILLLDRNNPNAVLNQGKHVSLEAYHASQVPELANLEFSPGIDGFAFEVTPLYKLESTLQWYIQVQYSIGPSVNALKTRFTRSTAVAYAPSGRSDIASLRNGTNMKPLSLEFQMTVGLNEMSRRDKPYAKKSKTAAALYGLLPFALAGSVILSVWAFMALLRKRRASRDFTTEKTDQGQTSHL